MPYPPAYVPVKGLKTLAELNKEAQPEKAANSGYLRILSILETEAADFAAKSAGTHIFDGDRVKFGFHARRLRALIEEIKKL